MTLRQEQERRLRSFGVFSRRVSPQPLEALPVDRLFGLLILHLPALAPGFAAFRLRPAHRLLPTVMTIWFAISLQSISG